MFLSGVRKNICAASFRDAQELHSLSALKGNIYIILCISVRESLFQRRSKFLSDWKGWGGLVRRLNNFLRVARCLDLVECFKIFHIN